MGTLTFMNAWLHSWPTRTSYSCQCVTITATNHRSSDSLASLEKLQPGGIRQHPSRKLHSQGTWMINLIPDRLEVDGASVRDAFQNLGERLTTASSRQYGERSDQCSLNIRR